MQKSEFKPITQSDRLILRPMQAKDAKAVYQYRNQPDVKLFQGWTPTSSDEVADYADQMENREFAKPGAWFQVILEGQPGSSIAGEVIGDVAFCIESEMEKQAELGIALDTRYHGMGYAQEAIKLLVSFLFERFDLHRIHVSIDPQNIASRKLFKRIGFREEAHLISAVYFKGEWVDDIIMAILRSEWH